MQRPDAARPLRITHPAPPFCSFAPACPADKVRVAIIREEGSNGDREMAAAVHAAGMEPWDITMSDLLAGRASLDSFRGIVFVGGFSYAGAGRRGSESAWWRGLAGGGQSRDCRLGGGTRRLAGLET